MTLEGHSYSTADQLADTGITYNAFGDVIWLPASDAGGKGVSSTFYSDNQLYSQTQNAQTMTYQLDPTRRTRETVATGTSTADVIEHYSGEGDTPAWTQNTTTSTTTRYIHGIGGLAAIQTNIEAPVLQLTDLQGNVVASAALSETETKPLSTEQSTEYGVPTTTGPAKYSWLGGLQLPTELSLGIVAMGARSYIPQLGRFLQMDPKPGGSANAYTYTYGNPVNETDPSGEYTVGGPSQALIQATDQIANEAAAEQAAINAAARAEAESKAAEAAAAAADTGAEMGAEGPLGGYGGWAEEYAELTGQEEGGYGGGRRGGLINPAWLLSGDGCGDGGYCGGHWVKRSEKGHRHGEPIGENPREEAEIGLCLGSWVFGPVSGGFTCATEAGSHLVPTR